MYRLYQQVESKLGFYCIEFTDKGGKYIELQQGPTIDKLYKRFGRNSHLLLLYTDQPLGMSGMRKMEKCLIIVLVLVGIVWLGLQGMQYYYGIGPFAPASKEEGVVLEPNSTRVIDQGL